MSINPTAAAQKLQENSENISSHQVISLLMDGGLERIQQAKASLAAGNEEEAEILLQKIVGIINGLRSSLNLVDGGDIAINLDALYDYMIARVSDSETDQRVGVMSEVGQLLQEVKEGWDEISV